MSKLLISYSHNDELLIDKFIKHITPLKSNGTIESWYDRKITPGNNFQEKIDEMISSSDIICLMISANFLSSPACIKEKDESLTLAVEKGIRLIPIILSPCLWLEHKELSELLAIPQDGKPITSFSDQDEAWLMVGSKIKEVCNRIKQIEDLKLSDEITSFLESAEILSKSHQSKAILLLTDIFVYPKLNKYSGEEVPERYDSANLEKEILKYGKIIISGENQSGKTSLCKAIYKNYRAKNYIPIYLSDKNGYLGNPNTKLEKAFSEQYIGASFSEVEAERIVPIIDNFHEAKHKGKYLIDYDYYKFQVIIVDDIFGLSIKNQNMVKEYVKFKIREFSALERNALISKWILINEETEIRTNPNYLQQSIDQKTEIIDTSLGIIIGKGIMPSYPFFILSLLAAQYIQKPLDQDITSQGYCYQALIYLFLRKQGVKNDQIDIYTNFLTELAFWIYTKGENGLTSTGFEEFITNYESHFNLPVDLDKLLTIFKRGNICCFDSLNQFNFCYSYIYYFFVAKYISENTDKQKKLIDKITSNLHVDENAYITIFISHHSKSNYLLDEILLNAEILFENYAPSTLDSKEMSFFDKNEETIIKAILPSFQHNHEAERANILKEKSEIEDKNRDLGSEQAAQIDDDSEISELASNLRLSIKTVEVMGTIIKNRSGSLDLIRLEYIYEQGLKVHLRILTSFIELVKNEGSEEIFIDFLTERINNEISKGEKAMSIDKIEKIAKNIFWNINFGVVHAMITKSIHSLGSSNLLKIAESVSKKEGTPAAFIVYQGINMWYGKNLRVDEIAKRINEDSFSKTAIQLIKHKIVEHCKLHKIDFRDLQKIEQRLQIPSKKLHYESQK